MGAVALALLFSLFNLIYGAWTLIQGIELRRTGKTLHHPRAGRNRGLNQVTPDRCAAASALAHPPPGWPARASPTSARPRPGPAGGHDVAPGPARHSARRAIRPSAAAASSG